MIARMRAAVVLAAILAACTPAPVGPSPPAPPAAAAGYAATRWVPARPTYLLAARSVRDGQRALGEAAGSLGVALGVDASELSHLFTQVLGVDALSPDKVAAIGVDLDGGLALFSDDLDPTFVVHINAPDLLAQYFDGERRRGLVTRSELVDGVEVFTAKVAPELKISWAIADGWLWTHFGTPLGEPTTEWFARSHRPGPNAWAGDFARAIRLGASAAPAIAAFVDLREIVTRASKRVREVAACANLVRPIGRVGFVIEGDLRRVGVRLAVDLGPAAGAIAGHVLAPPPGFAATAAGALAAAQWNLDLDAVAGYARPCVELARGPLAPVFAAHVRAARAVVTSFDADHLTRTTGAVALDLGPRGNFATVLADALDVVPARAHLERDRTFGRYPGHHLSIPFGPTLDYVLGDAIALVALGDGVLDRLLAPSSTALAPPPIAALDLAPAKLTAQAWTELLGRASIPRAALIGPQLAAWRDLHLAIAIERGDLVLSVAGNRK